MLRDISMLPALAENNHARVPARQSCRAPAECGSSRTGIDASGKGQEV
jgi:hypothetical protein